MAKEYDNIKLRELADINEPLRLPPRVLHTIICEILEEALDADSRIPSIDKGYVNIDDLAFWVLERQDEIVDEKNRPYYSTDYNIYELIKRGVNPTLEKVGTTILRKSVKRKSYYQGYKGVVKDFKRAITMYRELPVDKGGFDFVKGTLDFNTMSSIRNRINDVVDKVWIDFKNANPKFSTSTAKEKEIKAANKPSAPFICIEDSIYEFTPDYVKKTERERELLLKFADAIIYKKAVKVSYQALHYNVPDDLEFHPHYIRKVGNKLMVYGRSRSIAYHRPDEYTLVNLIVQRIKKVEDFTEKIHYYSAEELDLDYNNELFYNRMTFDAPAYRMNNEACTEVVLKVRKVVETPTNPRMPFERIKSEPLHHSQIELHDRPGEEDFGFISIRIKDWMRIRPILLKWGSDIMVESPAELRELMENEVRRMAALYGIRTE